MCNQRELKPGHCSKLGRIAANQLRSIRADRRRPLSEVDAGVGGGHLPRVRHAPYPDALRIIELICESGGRNHKRAYYQRGNKAQATHETPESRSRSSENQREAPRNRLHLFHHHSPGYARPARRFFLRPWFLIVAKGTGLLLAEAWRQLACFLAQALAQRDTIKSRQRQIGNHDIVSVAGHRMQAGNAVSRGVREAPPGFQVVDQVCRKVRLIFHYENSEMGVHASIMREKSVAASSPPHPLP